MSTGLLHTHTLVVILFLVLYLVKLGLLLFSRKDALDKLTQRTRIPEMVISTLFLLTGIGLMVIAPVRIQPLLIVKILMVLGAIPLAVIGFRRSNKILASLSVLLIIGSYGMAEAHAGRMGESQDPLPETVVTAVGAADYDPLAHGEALYQRNCVVCHGKQGALAYNTAANLQTSVLNQAQIKGWVQAGVEGKMPAYGWYSDQELEAVSAYTLSLKQE
jgi:mono/diheme cytochrome c family protein